MPANGPHHRDGRGQHRADFTEEGLPICAEQDHLLLRIPDAAARLGVGRSTFYELLRRREIPTVRLGRSVRVPVAALRAWVEAKVNEDAGAA